jgi:acetyl-CoA C-acetyltransferase
MKPVYVIDVIRTAIGKYGGALSMVRPDDYAGARIEIIDRKKSLLK